MERKEMYRVVVGSIQSVNQKQPNTTHIAFKNKKIDGFFLNNGTSTHSTRDPLK